MVQVCEDFESLRNLLFELLDSDNHYVYRGYSCQNQLLPNIIRFKDNTKNEIQILEEFEKYSGSYYNANNALDFLSYAQHFGLPTRLLDFSYNPFVALFFALNSPKKESYENEEDKIFYYICYVDLDKHNKITEISQYGMKLLNDGSYSLSLRSGSYSRICEQYFKDIEKDNKLNFMIPNYSNKRIMMQQGLFFIPEQLDGDYKNMIQANFNIIKINKELRNKSIKFLDKLGFNTPKLMSDAESLCKSIKSKYEA